MPVRRLEINFAKGNRKKDGKPIIAGSLNKLFRNGWIAFRLSGPPRLNKTMARLVNRQSPNLFAQALLIFLRGGPVFQAVHHVRG